MRIIHYSGEPISLGYGDQFYKAGKYTRLDGEINFIKHKNVTLLLQYSAHFFDKKVNSSQLVKLKFNLNGSRLLNLK